MRHGGPVDATERRALGTACCGAPGDCGHSNHSGSSREFGHSGVSSRRRHCDDSLHVSFSGRFLAVRVLAVSVLTLIVLWWAGAAFAAEPNPPVAPGAPETPNVSIELGGTPGVTQSVMIIALMTVLSVAPALLLLTTSFTKIAVVLALTRQAIGTPTIPPNQVLAGMAMFMSLFVMGPVLAQSWSQGVQPFMEAPSMNAQVALENSFAPLRTFMLEHTGKQELQTMIALSDTPQPDEPNQVPATTLIPAFVLSELKTAFIIGFVIFIPFLIIDLVVASVLMSMGMMMLPPIMISLPFKLLLFIMVDGWSLIATALVTSYR